MDSSSSKSSNTSTVFGTMLLTIASTCSQSTYWPTRSGSFSLVKAAAHQEGNSAFFKPPSRATKSNTC